MPKVLDSSRQQARFLECFAVCGQVIQAARWAKLHRQAHYGWLREDPTYRARFEAAEEKAARALEDEAVRRAREGVRRPVFYKGRICGYIDEYSDSLMGLLLKANNPKKFAAIDKETPDDRKPLGPSIQLVILPAGAELPAQPKSLPPPTIEVESA